MTPLRRTTVTASLLKLFRISLRSRSVVDGPGCSCESCMNAWHLRIESPATSELKAGWRPGAV
jgi:hypothetical protein